MKKVVLITGAGSNLGKEIVKVFKLEGFDVYAPTHSELDITKNADCYEYTNKIIKSNHKIDILINCAGITPMGQSLEKTADDYLKVLDINAVGPFRLTKAIVESVGKNLKIINISSLNGVVSLPNYGVYSSSKHALEAMSFALRQELKAKNIFITSILSGAIKNEKSSINDKSYKPARDKFLLLKYLMPFITPEEVANSVLNVAKSYRPSAQVVLGNDAKITIFLMKMLPFSLWDRMVYYIWSRK